MPRTSRKILFLGSLTKALNKRLQQRALRTIMDDEDSFADAVDLSVAMAIKKGFTRRYLFRKSKYRKGIDRFLSDLENLDEDIVRNDDSRDEIEKDAIHLPWLTDPGEVKFYSIYEGHPDSQQVRD
jgi:hypothetical protein